MLTNAIKFSPRDSTIEVIVEVEHFIETSFLKLTVKDYGAGIKKENQDKLF